ncbi:MAG: hypothetical protein II715_02350 [Clostridia bacterium]|nr:hypothetical protein [Clostridia bacterium]
MKRFLAVIIVLAMMLALPIVPNASAETTAQLGELLITSEKMTGAVGDVVKVNFYLYANLPDGRKFDSLDGTMRYDPEIVTLGAINQIDEENNLTSFMKGKASMFQPNIEESGVLKLAFIDAYGVEANGFWFQAEFRIEKEGTTDFVFNGIKYSGIDEAFKAESYYIDPVSVGGIYTEGQEEPTNGPVEETFAPLTPAVHTPAPVTSTPRPSHHSDPVPVTSSLPTYSARPTADGIMTPQPPVTSMPMTTNAGGAGTDATASPDAATQTGEATPEASLDPVAEATPETTGETEAPAADTPAPVQTVEETEPTAAPDQTDKSNTGAEEEQMNLPLVIGVIVGIVAVIGLGILAIVLILKRRKMDDDEIDDEEEEFKQKPLKKKK